VVADHRLRRAGYNSASVRYFKARNKAEISVESPEEWRNCNDISGLAISPFLYKLQIYYFVTKIN
jgi:hypothetical protein